VTPDLILLRNRSMKRRNNCRDSLRKINTEMNRRSLGFRSMSRPQLVKEHKKWSKLSTDAKEKVKQLNNKLSNIEAGSQWMEVKKQFDNAVADRRKCKRILRDIQSVFDERRKLNHYIREGIYRVDEVLPYIGLKTVRDYDGHEVKMWSQRYFVFRNNLSCVRCGLTGEFFALERDRYNNTNNGNRFHFNLYGYDNDKNEIMLTKDHILPKSKGGTDTLDNYQTMCIVCNQNKGDDLTDYNETNGRNKS